MSKRMKKTEESVVMTFEFTDNIMDLVHPDLCIINNFN